MTTAGDKYSWQFREKDGSPLSVNHVPRLMTDSFDALRASQKHLPLEAAADIAIASTPEDDAAKRSDIRRLAQLTPHLSDRAQELIALKYGAALNNRMIARITGLSESNVGTVLQRTVEKLRSQW